MSARVVCVGTQPLLAVRHYSALLFLRVFRFKDFSGRRRLRKTCDADGVSGTCGPSPARCAPGPRRGLRAPPAPAPAPAPAPTADPSSSAPPLRRERCVMPNMGTPAHANSWRQHLCRRAPHWLANVRGLLSPAFSIARTPDRRSRPRACHARVVSKREQERAPATKAHTPSTLRMKALMLVFPTAAVRSVATPLRSGHSQRQPHVARGRAHPTHTFVGWLFVLGRRCGRRSRF